MLDLKVSVVSTSSTLLYYLRLFLKDKHQPFSKQNYLPKKEETIRACIGGNVTLKFKPTIFPHENFDLFLEQNLRIVQGS